MYWGKRGSSESRSKDANLNRRTFLRATGAAGTATFSGIGSASPGRDPDSNEEEALVGVSKAADDVEAVVASHLPAEAEIVHKNETLSYVTVAFPEQAPDGARENFVRAVTENPDVRYAEENGTYEALYSPNDPKFGDQYAPQMVTADTAWDTTLGDSSVTVAVVDTGVQYDHPDLDANVRSDPGYDFVDDDSDPYPDVLSDEQHGTHVSGVASAETDNGTGVAGISESTIIAARVLDESGVGTWSNVADGIQWAADEGANVINLSLGGSHSSTVEDAVSYAHNQGALVVAAAGNDNGDVASEYPAALPECVAVSALDADGTLQSDSNTGEEIELAAPGSDVLSTVPTDSYGTFSGTSIAAPVVSGVAGLAAGRWDLSNRSLRRHLKDTAADVGLSASEQGSGRVDAANAVSTTPTLVVDDFEDADLDEYGFDRGSSGASVVSSPTHAGSYVLEYSDSNTEAISTSGLANYPAAGDVFRFRVQGATGNERCNVTWGVQDHQNRYYAQLDFGDGYFRFWKYENDEGTTLDKDTTITPPASEWLEIEVQWGTDGTQTVTLYDSAGTQLTQLSDTDATWTSGGVGYDGYLDTSATSGTLYFDDVTLDYEGTEVLDDFEDGDIAEYSEDTGGFQVQGSTVLEGSYSLEGTTTYAAITNANVETPRGYEYRCQIQAPSGSGAVPTLAVSVQNPSNTLEDAYWAFADHVNDVFQLIRRDNGSSTLLEEVSYSGFQEGAEYELAIELGADTVKGLLYDSTGNVEVETAEISDATYSGGNFGFYTGKSNPAYYDYVTKTPL